MDTQFSVATLHVKRKKCGRLSGGVAMYIRDDIACSSEILYSLINEAVQLICTYSKIEKFSNHVYRQPDRKSHGNPSTATDLKTALNRMQSILIKI